MRPALRRFFGVDTEMTVIATLHALAKAGKISGDAVQKAIKDLNVDPEKAVPHLA